MFRLKMTVIATGAGAMARAVSRLRGSTLGRRGLAGRVARVGHAQVDRRRGRGLGGPTLVAGTTIQIATAAVVPMRLRRIMSLLRLV